MRMNKKLLAIVMSFALLTIAAACGKEQSYRQLPPYSEINYKEDPVTVTYLTIGDKPSNGQTERVIEKINKILIKKVNAKLDIYYVGWKDYLENYNKCLEERGLGVDLVCAGADWLDAWPNAIKGNYYPMDEKYIQKYCPNTYAHVSKDLWKDCSYNGSIYFIPENEYSQWTNHGFAYRKDLAAEAGLEEGINSWSDLTEYFKYIRHAYPEMIPWDYKGDSSIPSLGYMMSVRKYIPIYEVTTYGIWGADNSNPAKIISPYYEGQDLIRYAELMKKWNAMGVWRSDVSLAGDNDAEFYSGQSAVLQHHTQNYYTIIKPNIGISLPEAEVDFYWFGKEMSNLVKVSNLHGAMAVSANSRNPERALMVYDILRNDPECYRLIRYGIEGSQYVLNDDGMLEKPSGYNEETNGIVTNFWWGRRDELEIQDSTSSWDDYYALIKTYDRVAVEYPWESVAFSTPEINSKLPPIVEVCNKYIPLLSTGQYEETAGDMVAEFRSELKAAGMEEVTAELQNILDSNK